MVSTPACGGGEKKRIVSVKPPEPQQPDADTATGASEIPDGSVLAERCVVDSQYLAGHKACSVDADCTAFTYQLSCCPDAQQSVVAITADDLEEVKACAGKTDTMCPCASMTRAEDGRIVSDAVPAVVQCVEQKCVSSVGLRACGSRAKCGPQEICVTYQNVPDGIPPDPDSPDNKLLTFRCVPNPCQGPLNCSCVQPICDARNDAERHCEIMHNAESDANCGAYQD